MAEHFFFLYNVRESRQDICSERRLKYGIIGSEKRKENIYDEVWGSQVQALSDVNFSVEPREYVAIMGESDPAKQRF